VRNEEEEAWDALKFRVMLQPANKTTATDDATGLPSAAAPAADDEGEGEGALRQHRLVLQLVGGKSATQVYLLSFHTISPLYQIHVKVPDHRIPQYASRETFHQWHPLLASLRQTPRVRMLVRVKPDGSGPLPDMCGCC